MARLVICVLLSLVALQLISQASADNGICAKSIKVDVNGKKQTFDLSALVANTYKYVDPQYTYEWRICNNMACPGVGVGSGAACQEWSAGGASLATYPNGASPVSVPGGLAFLLNGGTGGRSAVINIWCDPKAKTAGNFTVSSPERVQIPYILGMSHQSACGDGPTGITGGSIFCIIFFVGFIVYFLVGFLVLKFAMGAEGFVNAIPQHEFWASLPGLWKDGVMMVVNKIRGGPSSYETVA